MFGWQCMCETKNQTPGDKPGLLQNTTARGTCKSCGSRWLFRLAKAPGSKPMEIKVAHQMITMSVELRDALKEAAAEDLAKREARDAQVKQEYEASREVPVSNPQS